MPNYVRNKIYVRDIGFTEEQVEYIKKNFCRKVFLINGFEENGKAKYRDSLSIDFCKIVPQPDIMVGAGISNDTVKAYSAFYKHNPLNYDKETMRRALKESDRDEFIKDPLVAELDGKSLRIAIWIEEWFNKTKPEISESEYIPNWWDWNIQNWGTKWNSCGENTIDTDGIVFDTAWSDLNYSAKMSLAEKFSKFLTEEQLKNLMYYTYPYEYDMFTYYYHEIGNEYLFNKEYRENE